MTMACYICFAGKLHENKLDGSVTTQTTSEMPFPRAKHAFGSGDARSYFAYGNRRNKRVTTIQKWVRMHLQRARYRRDTDAGRRTAERAAVEARQLAAATVIQREARRWAAGRKVLGHQHFNLPYRRTQLSVTFNC